MTALTHTASDSDPPAERMAFLGVSAEATALLDMHVGTRIQGHGTKIAQRLRKAIVRLCLKLNRRNLAFWDSIRHEAAETPLGEYDAKVWEAELDDFWSTGDDWKELNSFLEALHKVSYGCSCTTSSRMLSRYPQTSVRRDKLVDLPWSSLSIPFEVPSLNVSYRADLEKLSCSFTDPRIFRPPFRSTIRCL